MHVLLQGFQKFRAPQQYCAGCYELGHKVHSHPSTGKSICLLLLINIHSKLLLVNIYIYKFSKNLRIHYISQDCETANAQNKEKPNDFRNKEEKGEKDGIVSKTENDSHQNSKCTTEANSDKGDAKEDPNNASTEQKKTELEEKSDESQVSERETSTTEARERRSEGDAEDAVWTLEEKDQLFQFITKVSRQSVGESERPKRHS